jgi:hypothetical protein
MSGISETLNPSDAPSRRKHAPQASRSCGVGGLFVARKGKDEIWAKRQLCSTKSDEVEWPGFSELFD